MKCVSHSPRLECGSKPLGAWDSGIYTGTTGDSHAAESEASSSFSSCTCKAAALVSSLCHLRWKGDSLAAGPRLCSAHGGPVASCLSRQELIRPKQSDRSGCKEVEREQGGTAVCHCPHFGSEGVLGAGVHGDRTMLLSPRLRCCCCQSHREEIWLIIPMPIEWRLCLPEGGETTPQKP